MANLLRAIGVPAPPGAARVESVAAPDVGSFVTLASATVIVAALYLARDVLIPVTLAVILSFLLAPVGSFLRRLRLPRTFSVLLSVFITLAVLLGLAAVIGTQIATLAQDIPKYESTLMTKVQGVREDLSIRIISLESRIGKSAPKAQAGSAVAPARPQGTAQSPVTVRVQQPEPTPFAVAQQIAGPVLSPLGTLALVLVVTIFILLQKEDLRDRLIRLFGSSDLHRTTLAMNDAASRLAKYFLMQLAVNAGFGVFITAGLVAIGVPSPALWGMLAMLLRFVPYVGIYLSAVLPVLLAAAVVPGWALVLWTLGLYLGGELITGQVVEPLLYGHSTGLSPVSIVVATIFWAWIWGPIGLILATPLTLCLVVLGRHVKRLEFLEVLLGDRPALTPVESLYQRLLANDPDEAATQAEALLRERKLAAYYDEVCLPALLLAGVDARRGVLSRERQMTMRDAVCGVVDDLDGHVDATGDDGETAEVETDAAADTERPVILCMGGRGPLDDAAAAMLAQLLRRNGAEVRLLSHEAVSRTAIATLDTGDASVLCLSYFEATGSAAHLRFMLRRLRQRAPAARLVVALWGADLDTEYDEDVLRPADARARTLGEAVQRSLAAEAAPVVLRAAAG